MMLLLPEVPSAVLWIGIPGVHLILRARVSVRSLAVRLMLSRTISHESLLHLIYAGVPVLVSRVYISFIVVKLVMPRLAVVVTMVLLEVSRKKPMYASNSMFRRASGVVTPPTTPAKTLRRAG